MMSLARQSLIRNPTPIVRIMQRTALRLLTLKVAMSAAEALADISLKGATVAVGGFGTTGVPETLVSELSRNKHAEDLTLIALDSGPDGFGLSKIAEAGKGKKIVTSFIGESKRVRDMWFNGEIDIALTPLGTIAAQLRAGGSGIPAFYTHTGIGTLYSQGGVPVRYAKGDCKDVEVTSPPRTIDNFGGRDYILEPALHADLSLVKAWKADTLGNLVFHGTARNSNPDCAKAGDICIAEAEEIVAVGTLDPNSIHLPGIFVDRVIKATTNEKPIQKLRIQSAIKPDETVKRGRKRIIKRLVKEFKDGMYVNLGIGIPVDASNYLPEGLDIELHAENGLLGAGPYPETVNEVDADYINAGKETITAVKGASLFSASESFEIVRGGHLDLTVLGGLQVSASGDLANWIVPGKLIPGFGGAFDLVGSGSRVIVTMDHVAKDGTSKIMNNCSFPLTGQSVVDMIITEKAVFNVDKEGGTGLTLTEIAPDLNVDDIRAVTGCDFKVAEPLLLMDDLVTEALGQEEASQTIANAFEVASAAA